MNVGILVPTHDGYSDIWPIAAELFKRFWPDRPWPMYWMSQGRAVPDIAKAIPTQPIQREEWGTNVARALDCIPEPLVLFWVEEIFLLSTVPNDVVMEAAEILNNNPDIGIIQLTRYYIQPERATVGHFTDYPRGEQGFSASLPALFRKEILRHLVTTLPKSNDFEQHSVRIMDRDFPSVRSLAPCVPMFRICDNALLAGPWRQCAIQHLNELGFNIDYSLRGISPDVPKYMNGVPA